MASTFIASNVKGKEGEWNPYYYKPFRLGRVDAISDTEGEDGEQYVKRVDDEGGLTPTIAAMQLSDHNCGYSYRIHFTSATVDKFLVLKYVQSDKWRDGQVGVQVDTLIASGNLGIAEYKWLVTDNAPIYIDIGIKIQMVSEIGFADDMVYQIDTTSKEEMEKKKVWHGGYSTWLRIPENEGKVYRTKVIPTTLINRNLSFMVNHGSDVSALVDASQRAVGAYSEEDTTTNARISVSLEWAVDNKATVSSTAMNDADAWVTGHGWQAGTEFADDLSLVDEVDMHGMYFHSPASDTFGTGETGSTQLYNQVVSGRAGYAKVVFQHKSDLVVHNDAELARNQFFPIILIIS